MTPKKHFLSAIAWLVASVFCVTAFAVGTSHWTQTTEADFEAGTFDNVVATNLGDLKLSRATHNLLEQDARVSAVYALAEAPDGSIYAATGPQGVVLRMKDDKVETVATLSDGVNCFSLLVDDTGRFLVGTGAAQGQIYRIDKPGDKPTQIFSAEGVQYIWAMRQTSDGNIYAATGPNGQLFEIHPDGTNRVLFDSDETNLVSLVSDGKDLLYAGSDPNGRIYRVNRKSGEMFVVFDAPESEITALAIDSRGNLYAGTGQSTGQEAAATETPAADEKVGRPEQEGSKSIPIPSEPPKPPEPPKMPLPGPGDPQPIPRNSASAPLHMMIGAPENSDSDSDAMPARPGPAPKPRKPPQAQTMQAATEPGITISPGRTGEPPAEGNAVYKIDPEGFVTEIFRQPVLVMSIYENNGVLLVATGGEGRVYQINPSAEETSIVTKVDPKQVLCLLPAKDGKIYMGMANDGQISSMSSGYAEKGTFTSPVLDAEQISRFGKLHLRGELPDGTKLTVATRSGNVSETADPGWSKWSDEAPAAQYLPITSPSARFLQYRLTFAGGNDGKATPVVDEVNIAYQMPNLPPQVKSVKVSGSSDAAANGAKQETAIGADKPESSPTVTVSWETTDPNNDTIRYTLYYRTAGAGSWILLKDKLAEATYDWNTRAVADGRYELKVVASDAMANPIGEGRSSARVSDPVEVDNTAPVIGDIKATPQEGSAKVAARVIDRTSTVASLEYAVDSSTDWQAVLPSDTIADSPEEAYDFTVGGLSAGAHQITLRATDAHGNPAYESVNVTVVK